LLEQVIRELAHFLNISYEEAKRRVENYNLADAARKWDEARPANVKEVEKFYKESDHYLYELIPWNYGDEFNKRVSPLFFYHNKKILEIGAGIGSLCIALQYAGNQTTYCDIADTLTAFARQRFQDRGFNIPTIKTLTGQRDYDMVVAIDFFEHIHKDALPGLLKEIAAVLKDGGFLYHRSTFNQQDIFPMHYDHSAYFIKMAKDAGLNLRDNHDLVKGGESQGIQIGIPIRGDMGDNIFYSFLGLKKPLGTKLTKVKSAGVDIARNEIIRKLEKDWLFFMDSDQTFHPDTLNRLLSWNLPVVSGLYFKSPGEPVPHVYRYAWQGDVHLYISMAKEVMNYLVRYKDDLEKAPQATILPAHKEDLIECDGVGGGCLLIHRRVLEAIKDPWFKCNEGAPAGEDFDFCRKVQAAGFKIFVDPGVICGHEQRDITGANHFLCWADPEKFGYPWGEAEITNKDSSTGDKTEVTNGSNSR
jgi:2-polyprenyl-3-methyl-5-hydroxy-6-metoxy-1,4-benzoquinol methylase